MFLLMDCFVLPEISTMLVSRLCFQNSIRENRLDLVCVNVAVYYAEPRPLLDTQITFLLGWYGCTGCKSVLKLIKTWSAF